MRVFRRAPLAHHESGCSGTDQRDCTIDPVRITDPIFPEFEHERIEYFGSVD